MKFLQVAFFVLLVVVSCTALEDKKTDKRGAFGFGYGHHGGPYYGGYGGYGGHHGYDYHSFSHGHSYPHGYYGHGYHNPYGYGHYY